MTTERGVVRRAAQLVALADGLRQEGLADDDDPLPHPVFWPALTADEAAAEWDDLRRWVHRLLARFPNAIRLPECWWRHNDLVEVLAALRDFERACFTPTSPATAAVEWQRALRDMENRMETWIKRFTCSVPGRGHELATDVTDAAPSGWVEFVNHDIDTRSQRTERARQAVVCVSSDDSSAFGPSDPWSEGEEA